MCEAQISTYKAQQKWGRRSQGWGENPNHPDPSDYHVLSCVS